MAATTLSKRWSDTSEAKLGQSILLRSESSVFIKDMNCIDFPCVNYTRLIAFGKKRENKTHGKVSHSTVSTFIIV